MLTHPCGQFFITPVPFAVLKWNFGPVNKITFGNCLGHNPALKILRMRQTLRINYFTL